MSCNSAAALCVSFCEAPWLLGVTVAATAGGGEAVCPGKPPAASFGFERGALTPPKPGWRP